MIRASRRGGLAGEPERVAHEVGDVLHLGALVVVREDHRVALAASSRISSAMKLQLGESAVGHRLGAHDADLDRRDERAVVDSRVVADAGGDERARGGPVERVERLERLGVHDAPRSRAWRRRAQSRRLAHRPAESRGVALAPRERLRGASSARESTVAALALVGER